MAVAEQPSEFHWDTPLLSFKDWIGDPASFAWGCFAPSVLFGRNVVRITDGETTFVRASLTHLARGGCCCWCCCLPPYAASFREKLRKKRNLPMDPYGDKHTHMFCHPCAICQEERELNSGESLGVVGPSNPTVDRSGDEARKHLEEVQMMTRDNESSNGTSSHR